MRIGNDRNHVEVIVTRREMTKREVLVARGILAIITMMIFVAFLFLLFPSGWYVAFFMAVFTISLLMDVRARRFRNKKPEEKSKTEIALPSSNKRKKVV